MDNTIENKTHFEELAKTSNFSPYVLVRRVDDQRRMYIPLHWMHRQSCARKSTPKDVLQCFYSSSLDSVPSFRRYLVDVNVLEVFEGRVTNSSDDESEPNATISNPSPAQKAADEKTLTGEKSLLEAIEMATENSAQTRITGLTQIASILSTVYMPDLIANYKLTIMDIVEKTLRRGKGEEQSYAAQIAAMLMFHIDDREEIVKVMPELMRQVMLNEVNSFEIRSKCCAALALVLFLDDDSSGAWTLMKQLESIFKGSYAKGDGSPSDVGADESRLHAAALNAWGLLLTLIPTEDFEQMINSRTMAPSTENLLGLLESAHVDVRKAAGEVTALVLESGRAYDRDFLNDHLDDLIDATHRLSTGSNKSHAKRDRKTQRATFRDVLQYVESNISPDIEVKFPGGSLDLDTWSIYFQYSAICATMGPGITKHLAENNVMRGVLQLGDKPEKGFFGKYLERRERKYDNAVNSKKRTLARKYDRQLPDAPYECEDDTHYANGFTQSLKIKEEC